MGDIVSFKRDVSVTSRQTFIESLIRLGASGSDMSMDRLISQTRETAWREATRIAEACCNLGWCPIEQESFPLVETVEPEVRQDLVNAAALVVACDRLLAEWAIIRPGSRQQVSS